MSKHVAILFPFYCEAIPQDDLAPGIVNLEAVEDGDGSLVKGIQVDESLVDHIDLCQFWTLSLSEESPRRDLCLGVIFSDGIHIAWNWTGDGHYDGKRNEDGPKEARREDVSCRRDDR